MTSTIPTRKLGKNGPQVPAIGFGLMGLDSAYGEVPPIEEKLALLEQAYKLGARNWDSAAIYGDSEKTVGSYFKKHPDHRSSIFLATKFGFRPAEPGQQMGKLDSTPEYARESLENSLKLLGLDHVDLFYCHRVDGETPIEKTVEGLAKLQKEGKCKYIGLSEVSSATLRRACAVAHIDAVQIEYSPFALEIEDPAIGLLQTCRELGVAVVAYSPLGRGMLTGAYKSKEDFDEGDFRRNVPRFSDENFPKNLEVVDKLADIAKRKGCTTGQISLAFLLAQGDDIIPIPGTKKLKYLEENLKAVQIKLTADDLKEIRAELEKAAPAGDRYPEALMTACFADTPEL